MSLTKESRIGDLIELSPSLSEDIAVFAAQNGHPALLLSALPHCKTLFDKVAKSFALTLREKLARASVSSGSVETLDALMCGLDVSLYELVGNMKKPIQHSMFSKTMTDAMWSRFVSSRIDLSADFEMSFDLGGRQTTKNVNMLQRAAFVKFLSDKSNMLPPHECARLWNSFVGHVDMRTGQGSPTALMYAVVAGNDEWTSALLSFGASPMAVCSWKGDRTTPIIFAWERGYDPSFEMMAKKLSPLEKKRFLAKASARKNVEPGDIAQLEVFLLSLSGHSSGTGTVRPPSRIEKSL